MGVAGRTAPGSGMEHTVSHLIEMAERPGEPGALHGAKVGALSVLAAMLWARVRRSRATAACARCASPSRAEMRPRVLAAFAELDAVRADGRGVLARLHAQARALARAPAPGCRELPERWPEFDAELDGLLAAPERLVGALRAARAPCRLRRARRAARRRRAGRWPTAT